MGLLKRRPKFQLTGLGSTEGGLYDGSFINACVQWWDQLVDERSELRRVGYRHFTAEETAHLIEVPNPEGRLAFEFVAARVAMPGSQSTAVLSLAYAFVLVVEAAATQPHQDVAAPQCGRTRILTPIDLMEIEKHYSTEGFAREVDEWRPYWEHARTILPERIAERVELSLMETFDNQVDRWSAAEGFDLRRSIGAADTAFISSDGSFRLPNFVDLLFEWGWRLLLAEQLIADGQDLKTLRYASDPGNPIDLFYRDAWERYLESAAQPEPPISPAAAQAARSCLAWFDGLDDNGASGVTTAAIRGYLWRRAEQTSGEFLEPQLSQAIERSRTAGNNRGPDEPFAATLAYAALQCVEDGVRLRLGSVGGLIQGPRSFERALIDTTEDFKELGIALDEQILREVWEFGVAVFEVERALLRQQASAEREAANAN